MVIQFQMYKCSCEGELGAAYPSSLLPMVGLFLAELRILSNQIANSHMYIRTCPFRLFILTVCTNIKQFGYTL